MSSSPDKPRGTYTVGQVPDWYRCGACGAGGVRLWVPYGGDDVTRALQSAVESLGDALGVPAVDLRCLGCVETAGGSAALDGLWRLVPTADWTPAIPSRAAPWVIPMPQQSAAVPAAVSHWWRSLRSTQLPGAEAARERARLEALVLERFDRDPDIGPYSYCQLCEETIIEPDGSRSSHEPDCAFSPPPSPIAGSNR